MYPNQDTTQASLTAINYIIQRLMYDSPPRYSQVEKTCENLHFEHGRISRMNTPNKDVYWSDLTVSINRLLIELGRITKNDRILMSEQDIELEMLEEIAAEDRLRSVNVIEQANAALADFDARGRLT